MATSQEDSVVLQQWQSALEAAGRRPNTFRLCFSVPGCVPKGSVKRWEDLYKLYQRDPAKGAACALSTALQSGPERFMGDFAADSAADRPVEDQLVTL